MVVDIFRVACLRMLIFRIKNTSIQILKFENISAYNSVLILKYICQLLRLSYNLHKSIFEYCNYYFHKLTYSVGICVHILFVSLHIKFLAG